MKKYKKLLRNITIKANILIMVFGQTCRIYILRACRRLYAHRLKKPDMQTGSGRAKDARIGQAHAAL